MQSELLEAASRDDCPLETLRELGHASRVGSNWIPTYPVFLRHMSFPVEPFDVGNAEMRSRERRATMCFTPVATYAHLVMAGDAEGRMRLTAAMPDIWRWLGYWTGVAFDDLDRDPYADPTALGGTFFGVLTFCRIPELIISEAVDVIVTFFCVSSRRRKLRVLMKTTTRTMNLNVPRDMRNEADIILACMVMFLQKASVTNLEDAKAIRKVLRPLYDDILYCSCMHFHLLWTKGGKDPDAKDGQHLLQIIAETTDMAASELDQSSERLLVTVIDCALHLFSSFLDQISSVPDTAMQSALLGIAVTAAPTLRSILAGQSSTWRLVSFLNDALQRRMLSVLSKALTYTASDDHMAGLPASSVGDARFLLEDVLLSRLWSLPVHVTVSDKIHDAPDLRALRLVERWRVPFEASAEERAEYANTHCYNSKVRMACRPVGYIAE
jgi:hypothetical protein